MSSSDSESESECPSSPPAKRRRLTKKDDTNHLLINSNQQSPNVHDPIEEFDLSRELEQPEMSNQPGEQPQPGEQQQPIPPPPPSVQHHPLDSMDYFRRHPPIPIFNFIIENENGQIVKDCTGNP